MIHAYLIAAHQYPNQLLRLVNALDYDNIFFYIHIDLKSKKLFHESKEYQILSQKNNVSFIESIAVYWGDFSQVEATLLLLKTAFKNSSISRFTLLSGIDYPIKSVDFINSFFKDNNTQYLSYCPSESLTCKHFFNAFYFYKYFGRSNCDYSSNRLKNFVIKNLLRNVQKVSISLAKIFRISVRKSCGLKYYHGSNWFSFTRNAVDYILNYIDDNEQLTNRFKYTACSDESFFIMLLMASPFKSEVQNDDLRLRTADETFYRGGRARNISDKELIISSKALWGRKFIPGESNEIMDYIDSNILLNKI